MYEDTVGVHLNSPGTLKVFEKWYKGPMGSEEGINFALLNGLDGSGNIFHLSINGIQTNIKNAVVTDTLPVGTSVHQNPKPTPSITGNTMTVDGIRIVKVNEDGSRVYVTNQFMNKISYNQTNHTLQVFWGDILPEEYYLVEYAVQVDDLTINRVNNQSKLLASNYTREASIPMEIDSDFNHSIILNKSVSKEVITPNDKYLDYTLKLKLINGELPTVGQITDVLDSKISFDSFVSFDSDLVDVLNENNKITIQIKKEFQANQQTSIIFRVKVNQVAVGEKVTNSANLKINDIIVHSNEVVTTKIDSGLQINKTDEEGNVLAGAEFTIYDSKNNEVTKEITNKKGEIYLPSLPPNDYTVIETQAPDGYELDKSPKNVTIEVGTTERIILNIKNKKIATVMGSAELTKVDGANKKVVLKGAVFKLIDAAGNLIKENLITDSNGKIIVNTLEAGNYQFIETKAPNGYELNTEPVVFKIPSKNTNILVQVIKENTKIESLFIGEEPNSLNITDKTSDSSMQKMLPKTGSKHDRGYIVSGVLMLLGALFLFNRRTIKLKDYIKY